MGRFGLDFGFGGEPHMADAVRTGDLADMIDFVEIVGGADVLDDVERGADRDQLGRMLHGIGEGADLAGVIDFDDEARAFALFVENARALLASARADAADGRLAIVVDEKTQPQALDAVFVQRESCGIQAAMLAAV